jgi:hypothetical protein
MTKEMKMNRTPDELVVLGMVVVSIILFGLILTGVVVL